MTIRLENVGMAVRDIEAAVAFFTDLGLSVLGRDTVSGEWADTAVGMHRVAFSVDDLEAALEIAARHGCHPLRGVATYEDVYRLKYVRGPSGIIVMLAQELGQGGPEAAVQIHHGLAEHAGRYRRFGEALTTAGYVVYAPDQRASGLSAADGYGHWGRDGWAGWVADYAGLNARIRQDHPGLPIVLLGHSLGSFGAQHYLLDHSADVSAAVLSGTGDVEVLVPALTAEGPADLSAFNAPFEHRTGFEWLSRDEVEVDKYVADEACGWSASMPSDMGSLLAAADPEQVGRVRSDLPVLLLSGDQDPVGGALGEGVAVTADRYRDAGLTDVKVQLYRKARHEILNETNRDQVTADIVAFLDRVVA